jgi:subtilisin
MKRNRKLLTALLAVSLAAAAPALGAPAPATKKDAPAAGYVVVLKDTVAVDAKVASLTHELGVSPRFVYTALNGLAATLTPGQAEALRGDPDVELLSLDREVRASGTQPIAAGEAVPPGIERIESAVAHPPTRIQRPGVAGAVLDTGVDLGHPDLNAVNGKDCVNPEPAEDDNGHGSHVAGTIGARNTGSGLVGVSPGTRIYAVKVLDALARGSWSQVICGLDWVTTNAGAKKIGWANLSLGGPGADDGRCGTVNGDALHLAICRAVAEANLTIVTAAGSGAASFATRVPAAYDEVLTATSMADTDGRPGGKGAQAPCVAGQPDDAVAQSSNFAGLLSSDVKHTAAAPGMCVVSTWLSGGYATLSGTSMASAHVAGTVANCLRGGFAPGPCAGLSAPGVVKRIVTDAALKPATYGFTGDANHNPPPGRYYGFLVSNLGY